MRERRLEKAHWGEGGGPGEGEPLLREQRGSLSPGKKRVLHLQRNAGAEGGQVGGHDALHGRSGVGAQGASHAGERAAAGSGAFVGPIDGTVGAACGADAVIGIGKEAADAGVAVGGPAGRRGGNLLPVFLFGVGALLGAGLRGHTRGLSGNLRILRGRFPRSKGSAANLFRLAFRFLGIAGNRGRVDGNMTADGVHASVGALLILILRAADGVLSGGGEMGRFMGAHFPVALLQLAQLRLRFGAEIQLVGALFQLAGNIGTVPLLLRCDGAILTNILYTLNQRVISGVFVCAVRRYSFDRLGHGLLVWGLGAPCLRRLSSPDTYRLNE